MDYRRVVVTGIGALTPIGNNVNDFWESIKNSVCGIGYLTKFDTTDFKVKIAAEIKNLDMTEYLTSPEIRKNDLYSQYALVAANEAVNDSNIIGNIDPERLGVYVGSGIGGINTLLNEHDKLLKKGPKWVSPFLVPMMIANIASGNIAIKYNAKGVNLPVVMACSTSSNAIGEAFRAIKYDYADAIIAGGSEASLNKVSVAGFTSITALSTNSDPKTACRPFDKDRDGFILGEGAGILILEEYEHAKKRNAKIYAEIVGYANTCDAYHMTAPDPQGDGAARMLKLLAKEAKLSDSEKLYINAHGTSTSMNDRCETMAIKSVLGDNAYKCMISSTKSMTGHLLGATGAVEAIASIMALRESFVPATINYNTKDEECDLDYVPNIPRNEKLDIAMSFSLGFGGHNAGLAFRKL
jgi:3-oxoacyl-[acyl-carrier-protein] synthase II